MHKRSCRPNREKIKEQRREIKEQQAQLREKQRSEGLEPTSHASSSNATGPYETVEEEQEGRLEAVTDHMRIIKAQLPKLLKDLSKISDPRNPKKTKQTIWRVFSNIK